MHFRLYNSGSVVMVEPVSAMARAFVTEYVDVKPYLWLGSRFACEPRLLDGLMSLFDDIADGGEDS